MPDGRGGRRVGAGRPAGSKNGTAKRPARPKSTWSEREALAAARAELGKLAVNSRRAGFAVVLQLMTDQSQPAEVRLRAASVALRASMPEQPAVSLLQLNVLNAEDDAPAQSPADLVRARLGAIAERRVAAEQAENAPDVEPYRSDDDEDSRAAAVTRRRALVSAEAVSAGFGGDSVEVIDALGDADEPGGQVPPAGPDAVELPFGVTRVWVEATSYEDIRAGRRLHRYE